MPRFTVDGVTYMSTQDAAEALGVKAGTLRAWIRDGVLPEAEKLRVGRRMQRGYTQAYVDNAKRVLEQGSKAG